MDICLWPSDPAPPAGDDQNQVRGNRSPVVDVSFPEIEKFDRSAGAARRWPDRLRLHHGRLQQILHLLRVPYTRGEEVSRPADDILFEIAQLAAQGVREVNLLGQNVNAWRGENYDGTTGSFAELLRLVAAMTVSTAFALPPAIRWSLPTTSLTCIAIRQAGELPAPADSVWL